MGSFLSDHPTIVTMPGMADHSDLADKCKKYLKFVFWGICILIICLSIAGISVAQTHLLVSQRLFIVILFFCFFAILLQGVQKLLKGTGQSKYEISERKMKSAETGGAEKRIPKQQVDASGQAGMENKAFDATEKGEKEEKWVKNYVPYDQYPEGKADTVTVESETTGEEKRREEEKGEKGEGDQKDEKWKENYVPYEE